MFCYIINCFFVFLNGFSWLTIIIAITIRATIITLHCNVPTYFYVETIKNRTDLILGSNDFTHITLKSITSDMVKFSIWIQISPPSFCHLRQKYNLLKDSDYHLDNHNYLLYLGSILESFL